MSSLLDQVEVKVARAKRAFTRSRNIVVAARDELDLHHRWLDRHRRAWAEGLKRQQRLLNRKPAIWAFKRLAIGLILFVPFVYIALYRRTSWILPFLRDLLSISLIRIGVLAHDLARSLKERLRLVGTALDGTRHHELQDRISGLDGQLWNRKAVARSRVAPKGARIGSLVEGRGLASAVGVIIVTLVAAGAVRATIPGLPAEAPMPMAPKVTGSTRAAAALPATVPPAPAKVPRPAPSPAPVAGFSVVVPTAVAEPLPMPAQTVASMMLITSPSVLAPPEPDATTALVAEESLPVKPKVKAKLKRKSARQEPQQQLFWWQRLPWLRVR